MTAAGLIIALVLIVAWAVVLPAVTEDSPASPVAGGASHSAPPSTCAPGADCGPGCECRWLAVTWPAMPSAPRLWQPRVCAGRVAALKDLITVCDPAGWPVASYAAGVRWPTAPEVALCP